MGLIDHVQIVLPFKYLSLFDLTCKNDFEIIHFSREHPRWQLAVQKNKKVDCQWIYSKCKMSNFTGNIILQSNGLTLTWVATDPKDLRDDTWRLIRARCLSDFRAVFTVDHIFYMEGFLLWFIQIFIHDGWCKFARRTRDFLRKCSACACRLQKFSILGKLVFSLWKQHAIINGFVPVFFSFA